jgi:HK97 family phage prohead protease
MRDRVPPVVQEGVPPPLADAVITKSFEGYGSVFNTIDSYGDTIVEGRLQASLREWKAKGKLPKMLLQHGGGGFFSANAEDLTPIGQWDEMREDEHGAVHARAPLRHRTDRVKALPTPRSKEGELDGLSIGFSTRSRRWTKDRDSDAHGDPVI